MAKKTSTPKPAANPERVRAVQELRRSNAATPHKSREEKMTRAEKKARAVAESVRSE